MAKGKYAARAAVRRDDADAQSQIAAYQHTVKRLTAELDELKVARAAGQAAASKEIRSLKAQRDEGLSPEVAALRQQLEEQRERADAAAASRRDIARTWETVFGNLQGLLVEGLRLTGMEALEVLIAAVPASEQRDGDPLLLVDPRSGVRDGTRLSREQILAVQASHGRRSRGDAVKLLNERMVAARKDRDEDQP